MSRPLAVGIPVGLYLLIALGLLFAGHALLVIGLSVLILMVLLAIFKVQMSSSNQPMPDFMIGLAAGALLSLIGSIIFIIYKLANIHRF